MIKKLLPRGWPFWHCAIHWSGPVFRIVWIGFWMISYDMSHRFIQHWPHLWIGWNDD